MSISQPKNLISQAKEAVASASCCPKKLTLIHAGIAAAASLLTALLTYLLGTGIGETGGLSGISSRAALETAQSLIELAVSLLSPFWALGFVAAALQLARRETVTPKTLLQGLRYWAPALRMLMLQGIIYFCVILISVQIGSFVYMLTPFSAQLTALTEQLIAAGTLDTEALSQLLLELDYDALMRLFWGMVPFLFLPALVLMFLLSYRLRLAQFILMDHPELGALFAILQSFRLTKKNCLKLFRLDLHFWWFYALEVLVQVLCYGELILPLVGVVLDMNGVLASFLFYALALVCQVGLYVWKKPQIFASYALFYDHLLPQEPQEEAVSSNPIH